MQSAEKQGSPRGGTSQQHFKVTQSGFSMQISQQHLSARQLAARPLPAYNPSAHDDCLSTEKMSDRDEPRDATNKHVQSMKDDFPSPKILPGNYSIDESRVVRGKNAESMQDDCPPPEMPSDDFFDSEAHCVQTELPSSTRKSRDTGGLSPRRTRRISPDLDSQCVFSSGGTYLGRKQTPPQYTKGVLFMADAPIRNPPRGQLKRFLSSRDGGHNLGWRKLITRSGSEQPLDGMYSSSMPVPKPISPVSRVNLLSRGAPKIHTLWAKEHAPWGSVEMFHRKTKSTNAKDVKSRDVVSSEERGDESSPVAQYDMAFESKIRNQRIPEGDSKSSAVKLAGKSEEFSKNQHLEDDCESASQRKCQEACGNQADAKASFEDTLQEDTASGGQPSSYDSCNPGKHLSIHRKTTLQAESVNTDGHVRVQSGKAGVCSPIGAQTGGLKGGIGHAALSDVRAASEPSIRSQSVPRGQTVIGTHACMIPRFSDHVQKPSTSLSPRESGVECSPSWVHQPFAQQDKQKSQLALSSHAATGLTQSRNCDALALGDQASSRRDGFPDKDNVVQQVQGQKSRSDEGSVHTGESSSAEFLFTKQIVPPSDHQRQDDRPNISSYYEGPEEQKEEIGVQKVIDQNSPFLPQTTKDPSTTPKNTKYPHRPPAKALPSHQATAARATCQYPTRTCPSYRQSMITSIIVTNSGQKMVPRPGPSVGPKKFLQQALLAFKSFSQKIIMCRVTHKKLPRNRRFSAQV